MKIPQMMKIFLAILVAALMASCVSTGHRIDQASADKIEKGKTTKAEVIKLIGSPDSITRTGNGDTMFVYSFMRATAKPATFIPIVGPLVGGANVQHQTFVVAFGADGIVKNYFSTQGGTESYTGLTTSDKVDMPEVEQGKRPK